VLCLCYACCTFGSICNATLCTLSCVQAACLQSCADVLQIFALFLVHAYSTRVWKRQAVDSSNLSAAAVEHGFQSPEGHSKLIMDGPWILLWPCFLLWPFFEGVVGFGFIHNGVGDVILLATPFCFCSLDHCVSATSPTALTVSPAKHPRQSLPAWHLWCAYAASLPASYMCNLQLQWLSAACPSSQLSALELRETKMLARSNTA